MNTLNTLFILMMWVGFYFPIIYFFRVRRWKKNFIMHFSIRVLLSLSVLFASISLGSKHNKNETELQYYLEAIQSAELITIIYTIFIISTVFYDAYLISKTKTFLYPVK